MRRFARFIIVLMTLMVASINNLSAAVAYPVQLNAQILPPYTNCLGDYVAGDLCRIRVTGLLRDLTKTQGYEVGISVKVMQGSQLRFSSMTNHVERLNPNEIHQFQLKDLLAEGNISAKYNGDGYCLKEGGYEFIFQAFDKGNERLPLSEPVHFFAYLSQSEPPRLISPADGECVNYQAAAVNFVWMESTVGSFNPKKQFRIEVYEVPENAENFDQQALINSNITKFTIEDIPGNLNFQSFANSAGKLVKGRTYLWRVQAFDKTTEVTDKKKIYSASSQYANGGYSKVYSFKYANCMPFEVKKDLIDESKKPEITSVDSSETSSTVHWRNEPEKFPCGYIVAFNKAGDTLSNWAKIEVGAEESSYTFKNIAPGVQYATHIIGICECNEGEEGEKVLSATSNDSTFTLPKPAEKECHSNIDALTSQKSIENLEKGSYITANGQNVKIVEIERIFSEKGDTLFTGKGVVYCPLLENKLGISVKFDSIRINENYEVMMGKVYAPTDLNNCAFLDADGLVNDNYTGTGAAPLQSEKYATYSSQNEIPVGQIGNVGGVLYAKNADGSFTKLGTLDAQAKLDCEPQENGVDYKQGDVVFSAESYWNPPFDYNKEPFKNASVEAYYLNFSMGLSKRYDAPWIAMEQGKATTIKAKLNDAQSDVEDDKIVFVCQTKEETVLLESSYDASKQEHTVTIYGGEAEKSMNIYAIYAGNGKCYTLGRARIQNMPSIEQNLVLVPMGRSKESVDKDGIQTYLNKIYGKLGVKYNVTVEDEFGKEEDGDFSFMADGLAVTGTGFMTTETDDMKTLKKLYKEKRGVKDDAAYIFILKKAKTDDGTVVAGDMPRSHQVGYVFSEDAKYSDAKTIAHELGHGLYSFEHTFENKGAAQGSTDNLMDYNDNVAEKMLKVWQWNLLYTHKNYTVPFLEDDEDAMFREDYIISGVLNHDMESSGYGNHAVLSPIGVAINIPYSIKKAYFNKEGGVVQFTININGQDNVFKSVYIYSHKVYAEIAAEVTDYEFLGYISADDFDELKKIPNSESYKSIVKQFVAEHTIPITLAEIGVPTFAKAYVKINGSFSSCVALYEWDNLIHGITYVGDKVDFVIPELNAHITPEGTGICMELKKYNVEDGLGQLVFLDLLSLDDIKDDEIKKKDLADFANYLTDKFSNVKFAVSIFDNDTKEFQNDTYGWVGHQLPSFFIDYLKKNKIYKINDFKDRFENYFTKVRDYDIVITNVDLWKNINKDNYNANSIDYVRSTWTTWEVGQEEHKKISQKVLYEYSINDLTLRYKIFLDNNPLRSSILNYETEGKAQPIYAPEYSEQYKALFGTNSAIYSWMGQLSYATEDVVKAYVAYAAIAALGPNCSIQTLRQVGKKIGNKYLKDFAAGALQEFVGYSIAYAITKDPINIKDLIIDMGLAGCENAFVKGSKYEKHASAAIACLEGPDAEKVFDFFDQAFSDDKDIKFVDATYIVLDCVGSLGLSYAMSSNWAKKLGNKSKEYLSDGIIRLSSKMSKAEVAIVKSFLKKGDEWVNAFCKVVYNPELLDFLKRSKFPYPEMTSCSLSGLASIYPRLTNSQKEDLFKIFESNMDVNTIVPFIYYNIKYCDVDQLLKKISDVKQWKNTITIDGNIISIEDFLKSVSKKSRDIYQKLNDDAISVYFKYKDVSEAFATTITNEGEIIISTIPVNLLNKTQPTQVVSNDNNGEEN